jgi:hypothetical protein
VFVCFATLDKVNNNGKIHYVLTLLTAMEDCGLSENFGCNISLYELLRKDIEG